MPITHITFTEVVLAKLAELEPFFSMSSGAAMEIFGFNPLRKIKRMEREARAQARRERQRVAKAFHNLVQADCVTAVKGKEGKYALTPKGWLKYARYYSSHLHKQSKTPQKGKGFIVIFDIPEKQRHFRDTFRRVLYALGFSQLQLSVFLTHDEKAFEFAARVIANCELDDCARLVIAEKIM